MGNQTNPSPYYTTTLLRVLGEEGESVLGLGFRVWLLTNKLKVLGLGATGRKVGVTGIRR